MSEKIMVGALGAQMRNFNFVGTGFIGRMDIVTVRTRQATVAYRATIDSSPRRKVVKVSRHVRKRVHSCCADLFSASRVSDGFSVPGTHLFLRWSSLNKPNSKTCLKFLFIRLIFQGNRLQAIKFYSPTEPYRNLI